MAVYKHRIFLEVTVEEYEIRGVSVQPVAEKHGEDPNSMLSKKEILEKNLALLTTGITSLIHHGHQNKIKDSAESMKEVINQLNDGFVNSGAESVSNKDYKKRTKL